MSAAKATAETVSARRAFVTTLRASKEKALERSIGISVCRLPN
jgi:hypothetical protein